MGFVAKEHLFEDLKREGPGNSVRVNVKYYFTSPSTPHYRPIAARFHGVWDDGRFVE